MSVRKLQVELAWAVLGVLVSSTFNGVLDFSEDDYDTLQSCRVGIGNFRAPVLGFGQHLRIGTVVI